jgi:hypothetical protein
MPGSEPGGHSDARALDAPVEPITVDGDDNRPFDRARTDDHRHLVELAERASMATGSAPNGWFAGPHGDPDRFELLGSGLVGGEGNTWRGRYHGELAAPLTLAVKELRRPPHAPESWPSPIDVRRWDDQRALLQYMRIDHLVTVLDIFVGPAPHLPGTGPGRSQDTPYVVMEWVPGPTLADELSGCPASAASLDERLAHVQHVAEALTALHSQTASAGNPTLHRDVKPTNCILDPRRGVVLVDVGTMRRMDDGYDHDGFHTPAYTAPEVLANPRAPRAASSDLYSLGALAYFCVVGEDPPVANQPEADRQIEARLTEAARAARIADVRGFVQHLRLMLDASAHRRPADARSWSRRLRSLAALRRRPLARSALGLPTSGLPTSGLPASAGAGRIRPLTVGVAAGLVVLVGLAGFQLRGHGGSIRAVEAPSGPTTEGAQIPGAPEGALDPSHQPGPGPGDPGGPGGGPLRPAGSDALVRSGQATITSPGNGGRTPLCTIIRGTSKLPPGQTLLTSVENVNIGDRVRHLQTVSGWRQPEKLRSWRALQFIGLPQEPVGGKFRIEVIAVPLAALQQQIAAAGGEKGPWRRTLPAENTVVASIFVTRSAGGPTDPRTCSIADE